MVLVYEGGTLKQRIKLNPRNNGGIISGATGYLRYSKFMAKTNMTQVSHSPRDEESTRIGAKNTLQLRQRIQEGRKDTIGL